MLLKLNLEFLLPGIVRPGNLWKLGSDLLLFVDDDEVGSQGLAEKT